MMEPFGEEALYAKNKMILPAKVVPSTVAVEINTYEQLRELDSNSNQLKSDAIETACKSIEYTPGGYNKNFCIEKGNDQPFFPF